MQFSAALDWRLATAARVAPEQLADWQIPHGSWTDFCVWLGQKRKNRLNKNEAPATNGCVFNVSSKHCAKQTVAAAAPDQR